MPHIEAGKLVRYQHLRFFVEPTRDADPWLCSLLATQAILVAIGLRRQARALGNWVRLQLGLYRTAVVLVVFVVLSASPLRNIDAYAGELLLAFAIHAVQLGNVILVVASFPRETLSRFHHSLTATNLSPLPTWRDPWVVAAAVWVLALSALLSSTTWERHPHIPDEVAYLYQAKYFAKGMVTAPPPAPVADAFEVYLIKCRERSSTQKTRREARHNATNPNSAAGNNMQ